NTAAPRIRTSASGVACTRAASSAPARPTAPSVTTSNPTGSASPDWFVLTVAGFAATLIVLVRLSLASLGLGHLLAQRDRAGHLPRAASIHRAPESPSTPYLTVRRQQSEGR